MLQKKGDLQIVLYNRGENRVGLFLFNYLKYLTFGVKWILCFFFWYITKIGVKLFRFSEEIQLFFLEKVIKNII